MRVRLKGLNRATKRLADGRTVTYHYAWRGGPQLRGEPGTPEFIASYNEAVARKVETPAGTMLSILRRYQEASEFTDLAERTRADYIGKIKLIERKFGTLPLAALSAKRTRGLFKDWRDELAKSSRRQADYAWVVLARVLSWALDRGLTNSNPCEKGGRLYRSGRVDKIWSESDEKKFLKLAPTHMRLPFLLAVWTAQRQGDLLRLPWSAYDGSHIRLTQRKSVRKGDKRHARHLVIPAGAPLKAALDKEAKRKEGPLILMTSKGRPWTEDGFRVSWRKACAKAGVTGVTFHDLRGTAVTRLALVGCTEAEIAGITGHALSEVQSILDAHYLHRTRPSARTPSGSSKGEQNLQTGSQTVATGPAVERKTMNDFSGWGTRIRT